MSGPSPPGRIPVLLGSDYAALAIVGGLVLAVLLGFPVFQSHFDESRRPEVLGCYYVDNIMVMELTPDRLRLPSGAGLSYAMSSDKIGLAILPSERLRLGQGTDGRWGLVRVAGQADMLRFQDQAIDTIAIRTIDDTVRVAGKSGCMRPSG